MANTSWATSLLLLVTTTTVTMQTTTQTGGIRSNWNATDASDPWLSTTTQSPHTPASPLPSVRYVVAAAETVRPGEVYRVAVMLLDCAADTQFSVVLREKNSRLVVASNQTLLTNGTKSVTIDLQVPVSVSVSTFKLEVAASGGLFINESRTVFAIRKTMSIFIQTDKPIYSPGETVLFRVITVRPDLRPYSCNINISILDSRNNTIMKWLRATNNNNGLFNSSFLLSTQPVLGSWTILVVENNSYTNFAKRFEVAKYQPATFDVKLLVPPTFYVNLQEPTQQQNLTFLITAWSRKGRHIINGSAAININVLVTRPYDSFEFDNPLYNNKLEMSLKVKLINGETSLTIAAVDLRDSLRFPYYDSISSFYNSIFWETLVYYRHIIVNVTVTDDVTGRTAQVSERINCSRFRPHDMLVKFQGNTSRIVKPGIPFTGTLSYRRLDGEQLNATDLSYKGYKLFVGIRCRDPENLNSSSHIISNVTLPVPGFWSFSLHLNYSALYLDSSSYFCLMKAWISHRENGSETVAGARYRVLWLFRSRNNEALSLSISSPRDVISAGSTVSFQLLTTTNSSTFFYQLLSKGSLVKSDVVTFAASKTHELILEVDRQLASQLSPTARLLVSYVTQQGEVISESLDFTVDGAFVSHVAVSLSATSVRPGDMVTITVRADAGSHIALLAVDQEALRVPGNDITQTAILRDLFEYHKLSRCLDTDYEPRRRRKRDVITSTSSGFDSSSVFWLSGVTTITDAYVLNEYNYWCRPLMDPFSSSSVEAFTQFSNLSTHIETWLWTELTAGVDGQATLRTTVPDSVATWSVTAFAISPTNGLSTAALPVNLSVTMDFSLSILAPFSVVRGEEFALQVSVQNRASIAAKATVTLLKSANYYVRTPDSNNAQDTSVVQTIQLPAGSSVDTFFWIVPIKLGLMTINVTGASENTIYMASTIVLVELEGVPEQFVSSAILTPPTSVSTVSHVISINTLPSDTDLVPDSVHITVSAVGDILGQTIDGLDNLLHMPYGCGEQNMMNFAPDVYILKYLRVVGKTTPDIENKALGYIVAGYQRELMYQRSDGSFSAFGNWDRAGSVWLTAFVAKCFHEAREFIALDESNVATSLNWMLQYLGSDGAFREPGRVIHYEMQGASAGGEPLTAYVLISLLENSDNSEIQALNGSEIETPVRRARQYLESRLNTTRTNPYSLSISCYALQLANSSSVDTCLQYLQALAITDNADGEKYWKKIYNANGRTLAVDVEMTAYALLTYTRRGDFANARLISKWILAQRNCYGGFISTQDTVVALQALAEYAKFSMNILTGNGLTISLSAGTMRHSFAEITSRNALNLQTVELPSNSRVVNVNATGGGFLGIVQLIVRYNTKSVNPTLHGRRKRDLTGSNSSLINVRTNQQQVTDKQIILEACANYTGSDPTGMCIMEITMPSGYAAVDPSSLRGQAGGNVKNIEVKENTNDLILYLDELTTNDTCINATLNQVVAVSNVQPSRVSVYLYYNPDVKTVHSFQARSTSDWCSQCQQCCACNAPDYFICDNKCHAASAKCDGVNNCKNGQDEQGCDVVTGPQSTTKPIIAPPRKSAASTTTTTTTTMSTTTVIAVLLSAVHVYSVQSSSMFSKN